MLCLSSSVRFCRLNRQRLCNSVSDTANIPQAFGNAVLLEAFYLKFSVSVNRILRVQSLPDRQQFVFYSRQHERDAFLITTRAEAVTSACKQHTGVYFSLGAPGGVYVLSTQYCLCCGDRLCAFPCLLYYFCRSVH